MCRPRSSPIVAIKRGRVARLRAGVDALVPDIRRREDRAARGARQGRRAAGVGRWMARRIARIRAGQDLAPVGEPVAVGVDLVRMGPAVLLVEVAQAVLVAVLLRIRQTVAIGVGLARVDHGARLAPVPEAVAVGVLAVVRSVRRCRCRPSAGASRTGTRRGWSARSPSGSSLASERPSRSVSFEVGARPRAVALERVGKPVAVRIGRSGCHVCRKDRGKEQPGQQDALDREPDSHGDIVRATERGRY